MPARVTLLPMQQRFIAGDEEPFSAPHCVPAALAGSAGLSVLVATAQPPIEPLAGTADR